MTDRSTVLLVVRLLGGCALLLVAGSILLTYVVIAQAARTPVDPAAVAVLAGVTSLTGTAVGALAALLVSTRSQPEAAPPEP